jgi:hypothetical protein
LAAEWTDIMSDTAAIATVEVRYREETTGGFDTVTILPGGLGIQVAETR